MIADPQPARRAELAGGVASASDSGRIKSIRIANTVSALCQPKLSISATPSGENRNCPNEPAAVPAPSASPRFSGGNILPNADSTSSNEAAGQPEADQHAGADSRATSGVARIAHQDKAGGIEQRADAHHAQNAEAVGDARRRSAAPVPTAGSAAPARGRTRRGPRRIRGLIGCRKKPRLERGPKLNSAIAQPQMMMTSGVRQLPTPQDGPRAPVVTAIISPCNLSASGIAGRKITGS